MIELKNFQKKFNRIYISEVRKIISNLNKYFLKYNPDLKFINKQLLNILLGGKKIRPFIIYSIYKIFKKNKDTSIESIKEILVAMELFHNFCLIHDDIIDNGKLRHGYETINYLLNKKFKNVSTTKLIKFSEGEALLIGDLIFNEVFYVLNSYKFKDNKIRDLFYDEFYDMIRLVVQGQILDVYLTIKDNHNYREILKKNILKTSYYSFVKPMKIGYILSGNEDKNYIELITKIGTTIGLLYQIQDDIFDFIGDEDKIGKNLLNDIVNNQKTFVTYYLKNYEGQKFKIIMNKIKNNSSNNKNIKEIKYLITKSNLTSYYLKEINKLKAKINKIKNKIHNRDFLTFIDYIFEIIINRKN
jgi:geranylgeranyl pyrophosphate synthase